MSTFHPDQYGGSFAHLLATDRRRPLDQGGDDQRAAPADLASLSAEAAFAHTRLADVEMACCCLAGVWLLYDDLDASHAISQGVPSAEGSFWHGIMHRREGDYSNAKYWFRKVGDHPVFEQLGEEAVPLDLPQLAEGGCWNPFAFVDACQAAVRSGGAAADRCRAAQQREWELLFDHCYRAASAD